MRRVGVVLSMIVLAACTRGHGDRSANEGPTPPTQVNAAWVCRQYTPGPHVSAEATTVAEFRSTTIGTVGPTQLQRFPKLSATTAAAWCWSGKPGAYRVYEVASDGEVQQVVAGINGIPARDAHGAPAVP
jgi:hypothetical protein